MKNQFDNRLNPKRIECMDEEMVKIYKQKSPMERIKIGSDMYDSAWQQINAVLRSMYPAWSDEAIDKEIIKRLSHK
jgi:hypothetical protein